MKVTFEEGLHTSRKWCHLIIDALTHVNNEDIEEDGSNYGMDFNEEVGSKSTYTSYTDDGMVINHDGGLALNFDWDEEISDLGIGTDWGPPARAHRTALNLLNKAVTAAYASHKPDMEELAEDIIGRLGDLEILIAKHGTMLGDCFRRQPLIIAYANGRAFGDDLRDYAAAANITKESLLSVISRVSKLAKRGTNKAIKRIKQVEKLLNAGPLARPPSPPMTLRTSNPPVDADTPLGTVSIGGKALEEHRCYL